MLFPLAHFLTPLLFLQLAFHLGFLLLELPLGIQDEFDVEGKCKERKEKRETKEDARGGQLGAVIEKEDERNGPRCGDKIKEFFNFVPCGVKG